MIYGDWEFSFLRSCWDSLGGSCSPSKVRVHSLFFKMLYCRRGNEKNFTTIMADSNLNINLYSILNSATGKYCSVAFISGHTLGFRLETQNFISTSSEVLTVITRLVSHKPLLFYLHLKARLLTTSLTFLLLFFSEDFSLEEKASRAIYPNFEKSF